MTPPQVPPPLLVLGTDLAGKDHCANVVADAWTAGGGSVERRRGAFSGTADRLRTSERKSALRLAMEWLFLATLPLHCRVLPVLMSLLIEMDLRRFRRSPDSLVLVVSHTAIRLLAFALGHRHQRLEDIHLPSFIERTLRSVTARTGVRVVVLDIDHAVREERLCRRLHRGTIDHFDRYMGSDPVRSERIEAVLVWLATTFFGAIHIINDNLSDGELLASLPNDYDGIRETR